MTDELHNKWDIVLKIVTAIGLTTAFFIGIWQYNENREREYYFELWKQKKEAYTSIIDAASKFIYGPDSLKSKAFSEFLLLDNGSFDLVANRDVWSEANTLRALLNIDRSQYQVDQLAKLTEAANKDLISSWNKGFNYDLEAIKKRDNTNKDVK